MVAKIDSMLFHYAGWLIKIAAFFGISRWQLIVVWIFLGANVVFFPTGLNWNIIAVCASFPFAVLFGIIHLYYAKKCFREDEILSNDPFIRIPGLRLTVIVSWLFISFIPKGGFELLWLIIFFATTKLVMPFQLWPWFCLHQSPKDPVTLRKLVKSLAAKIRKALAPTPQPRLAPQPVSAFAPLP